jgi:polyisoprenoid-binding protein YceI
MKNFLKTIFFSSIFWGVFAFAQVPQWQIIREGSTISFAGTQNNAPVTAEFTSFDAKIYFDENNLKDSHVNFTVDMNSIKGSFVELISMLKTSDWFDTSSYPTAKFTSTAFTHQEGNQYQVSGELEVRDKKAPITLLITVAQKTPTTLLVKGETDIKRTMFGVGQGDWSDTKEVKDEVKVNFTLHLKNAT